MDINADPQYTAIIYVHSEKNEEENELIAQVPFMAEWSNEEEFDEALNQAVKSLHAAYQFWPGEYVHIRVVRQHTYVNMV